MELTSGHVPLQCRKGRASQIRTQSCSTIAKLKFCTCFTRSKTQRRREMLSLGVKVSFKTELTCIQHINYTSWSWNKNRQHCLNAKKYTENYIRSTNEKYQKSIMHFTKCSITSVFLISLLLF